MSQVDLRAELDAARATIDSSDHRKAAEHLARLLPIVPAHPLVLAELARFAKTVPDPMAFVPTSETNYGSAALGAYLLGAMGREPEAWQILRPLIAADKTNGIIDWVLPWLDAGKLTAQSAAVAQLYLGSSLKRFPRRDLEDEEKATVSRWLPHLAAALTTWPITAPVYGLYLPLLSKTGNLAEAVRIARARHTADPSYSSAVSLAATLRDARDYDGWLTASQECLKYSPDDVDTRLDMGDCFWEEQDKLAEAEHWYADAVRLSSRHSWAHPSLLTVRYLHTGVPRWRNELEVYAETHPDNHRAQVCLWRVTPFFAEFVYPADASVNILKQLAPQVEEAMATDPANAPTGKVTITTNGVEYPSCRASVERQLQDWGGKIEIIRDIRDLQSPDPRQPLAPVRYRLWEYDDMTPRAVVSPPPAEVAEWVAAIAKTRYDIGQWSDYARQVGEKLGEGARRGLLGTMVHPPEAPLGVRPWDWLARVQVAAALVLARLGNWHVRREVLADLLHGPADWPTLAAVVALTAVALEEPELTPEVSGLFTELYKNIPRPGADWCERTILNCHLRLPGLANDVKARLRGERAEFENCTNRKDTEAELAAKIFLAREIPQGVDEDDMARIVISVFASKKGHDYPGFAAALRGSVAMTEMALIAAIGELKEYLEEQARVLGLIEKEMG